MNKKQRLVLVAGGILILLQLAYPPWIEFYNDGTTIRGLSHGRAWIFQKPAAAEINSSGMRIHSSEVTPGIAVVAIATFVAFHLTRTRVRKEEAVR